VKKHKDCVNAAGGGEKGKKEKEDFKLNFHPRGGKEKERKRGRKSGTPLAKEEKGRKAPSLSSRAKKKEKAGSSREWRREGRYAFFSLPCKREREKGRKGDLPRQFPTHKQKKKK